MKKVEELIKTINTLRRNSRLTQLQRRKLDDARRELAVALTRLSA